MEELKQMGKLLRKLLIMWEVHKWNAAARKALKAGRYCMADAALAKLRQVEGML